jgi:hypothetical protein
MQLTMARREKMKAAVAFIGGSGSGKTLSMIVTAYGMMKEAYPDLSDEELFKKIGVVDTEHKRAQIYAGMERAGVKIQSFQHIDFQAPYSTDRYDQAIQLLKNAGCEVVIIDSISHAWEGSGGLLDKKEEFGGNFQAWNKVKPFMQQFVKSLTENDVHILVSMRTKQDYQVEKSDTGKLEIKKMGLKPIQKDDLEYEFMIVFQLDQDHNARATKDNSGMFENQVAPITSEAGHKLFKWLEQGVDVRAEEEERRQKFIGAIKQMAEEDEAASRELEQLVFKAKAPVEEWQLDLLKRGYKLVETAKNQNQQSA